MICYRDKTFCNSFIICKNGYNCNRALTAEIREQALKSGLHLSVYIDLPECFKPWFEKSLDR